MAVELDTKIDIPVPSLPAVESLKQTAIVMDHEGGEEYELFGTPNVCFNNYKIRVYLYVDSSL